MNWKKHRQQQTEDETPEGKIQCEIFQWHWNNHPSLRRTLFHVNNKSMNKIEGSRMKAKGVVKGPSDLILICPPSIKSQPGKTAYIEVKTPEGTQESEQKEFQKQVEEYGCQEYYIVRSAQEGIELITRLQGLPPTN